MTDQCHQHQWADVEPECGEIYYGHLNRGEISGMDWSIPRHCNKPAGHEGNHWWDRDKPEPPFTAPRNLAGLDGVNRDGTMPGELVGRGVVRWPELPNPEHDPDAHEWGLDDWRAWGAGRSDTDTRCTHQDATGQCLDHQGHAGTHQWPADPEFVAAYRAAQARLEAEDAAQSADTFTQQTREEWIEVAQRGILQSDIAAGFVEPDNDTDQMHRDYATAAVDALLAHLAAQQARPMPGGGDQ